MEQGPIVNALSLTIVIGCVLLVVNVLIFVGVYYQVNRGKKEKPAGISAEGDACNQGEYDSCSHPEDVGGSDVNEQKHAQETNGTLVRPQHQNIHRHPQHSPRQLNQYQLQEV